MYISLSFPLTKSKRDVTTILNINILPPENKMPEKNTEEYRNYVKGNWKSGEQYLSDMDEFHIKNKTCYDYNAPLCKP
jgi:hypothetical protein